MERKHPLPLLPATLPARGKPVRGNLQFLLGAKDAEMNEIETILMRQKLNYAYAMADRQRVHPGNAYEADPIRTTANTTTVFVECEPRDIKSFVGTIRRIDHHRPGDPGYGKPPEMYWEASSIGQLYAFLQKKQKPTKEHLIIAARDHCRFKVRQCPGVLPSDVSNYGRRTMALEKGIRRQKLDERIQFMRHAFKRAHHVFIGEQPVADMRRVPIGEVYSVEHFSLYEALADVGGAALVHTTNTPGHPDKVLLMGNVEEATVRHFMRIWAPAEGLVNIYGCEVRGYAGGYYSKPPLAQAA